MSNEGCCLLITAVNSRPHWLRSLQRGFLRWKLAKPYRQLAAFNSMAEVPRFCARVENYRTLLIVTTTLHGNSPLQRIGCATVLYQGHTGENATRVAGYQKAGTP